MGRVAGMSHPGSDTKELSRERVCELLAVADAEKLVALADRCLEGADLRVVRPPETGTVLTRVREPVAGIRFNLVDLLVSSAEVEVDGVPGWGMRVGEEPEAALAQAVCDARVAQSGPYAGEIRDFAADVAATDAAARRAEWDTLAPTIVEFEEVL